VSEQPPEPAELVPGLPYSLNQIVLKALAKGPDQRYRTAAEFSADLVAARSGGPLLAATYDPSIERTAVQPPDAAHEGATRVLPRAGSGPAAGATGVTAVSPGRPRKRSPWPWIALVVFLAIAAVAGVLVWRSFFNTTTVPVPPVVGQTQAAATAQLKADGFAVKVNDDYSDQFGVGLVTKQQPGNGSRLAKGGTVDIWVSRGPASTTLQDLSGFSPAAVAAYLAKYGLVGHELFGTSATVPKGQVYRQRPAAGTPLPRGATVTYWVSSGQPQVKVPDLSGLDQTQATAALQALGLLLGTPITQTPSDTVPVGEVVSQSPAAFALVPKGASVTIVISSGTPSPSVSPSPSGSDSPATVPSVVTMPQTQAEILLQNDGFVVRVKYGSSSLGSGYVYDQDPAGDSTALAGSVVTIWVTK
jgi:serine/threonine-protein kinase